MVDKYKQTLNILIMNFIKYATLAVSLIIFAFCAMDQEEFDAFGHFETDEIKISAENPGRLVEFDIEAGLTVDSGFIAGIVDTIALSLQKDQVIAKIKISSGRE